MWWHDLAENVYCIKSIEKRSDPGEQRHCGLNGTQVSRRRRVCVIRAEQELFNEAVDYC